MKLSEAPTIHETASVTDCTLGRWTEVGAGCSLTRVAMGDYSYIVGGGQAIDSVIGKFANIAAATRINPGNHPTWRATQHHFTYRSADYFEGKSHDEEFFAWRRSTPVTIGHDVWIGHGAVLLPGVTVHDGAVIAAGAVVRCDVGPYEIHGGVPARKLKDRFERSTAERMRALGWWDWSHERLHESLPDFRALSAEAFIGKYE